MVTASMCYTKIHYVKVAQCLNSITIHNFSTLLPTAPVKPADIDVCCFNLIFLLYQFCFSVAEDAVTPFTKHY